MRITLKNGSQIKVCGADNVDSYRGVKPNPNSIITFEECKDLKEDFITAFLPNLSVNNPILLMVGTPAEFEGVFSRFMELAKTNKTWRYFHAPTSVNPHVSKDWLAEEKQRLVNDGEFETYLREYEAIYVKGGKRSIYPWILTYKPKPLAEILPIDLNKWQIIVTLDPASTSVFGVTFAFWNEYIKKLIFFDEIYQSDPVMMTARKMWTQIQDKLEPWKNKVKSIEYVIDEAAIWCAQEINEIDSSVWINKTQKHLFGIDGYINLVRHTMNSGVVDITDNCVKFMWEHENYIKNENNMIPKRDDHLVNCAHYCIASLGLDFNAMTEPKKQEDLRRGYTIDEEISVQHEYGEFD